MLQIAYYIKIYKRYEVHIPHCRDISSSLL